MQHTTAPQVGAMEQWLADLIGNVGSIEREAMFAFVRECDAVYDVLQRASDEQVVKIAALERQWDALLAAATTIYSVTNNAFSRRAPVECPHGNLASYPTHARWCDRCWDALEDAIAAAKEGTV